MRFYVDKTNRKSGSHIQKFNLASNTTLVAAKAHVAMMNNVDNVFAYTLCDSDIRIQSKFAFIPDYGHESLPSWRNIGKPLKTKEI